jgi:uncharacterized protein (TIGR00266 family)
MTEWYYAKNNQQNGPISTTALQAMASDGRLLPTDLVWKEGLADWTPASRVENLFKHQAAASSPAAPPPPVRPIEPSRPSTGAQRCHEISYEIHGDDMQVVEVELDPGETVVAEAGAMNYMEDGIVFEARMGDGSQPDAGLLGKLFQGAKRMMTGESLFMTHFTNQGSETRRVAFAAPYPGKIVAMDLARMGGEIICQKDAFLCAALGTQIGIAWARKLGTGFFGGEGFILQRLNGDGMAFIHAGGTIVRKELGGETLRVDTGCLVAFTPGIEYDIQRAGGLKSMFLGGEGLFLATLSGTGVVWLQTLPFSRLADRVLQFAPRAGGSSKGEGSILGGLGNLLGDQ